MEIVELKKEQWELCKELRLRALKDAPTDFAETYEDAKNHDDNYWIMIANAMSKPNKQRMFIATESDEYLGSVYAIYNLEDKHTGRLGGMWVDSRHRKKGVGAKLFLAHKSWAKSLELKRIKLWVEDIEQGAKIFYSKLGFQVTDIKDHSLTKTSKKLCEMQYEL